LPNTVCRRVRGTITVDGITAGFDKPLHQHGQLLFDLGKHLGGIATKPRVRGHREFGDELSGVALDHPAVNAAGLVVPCEVIRGNNVKLIPRKLEVERVM
jgi:hypothetical protein